MTRRLFLLVAAALAAACSSSSDVTTPSPKLVHPTPAELNGRWVQSFPNTLPGNFLGLTLVDSAGVVSGNGSFAGEAGPFGTLLASGEVQGDTVHLDLLFKYDTLFRGLTPGTGTFVGVMSSHDDLVGQLTRSGSTSSVHFVRTPVTPAP